MTPSVPTIDSGIATAGMNVARGDRRKTNTTRTTSTALIPRVTSTSDTDARMVCVRSLLIWILMAGEIELWSSGSSLRTRSLVSMTFASDCFRTISSTARCPSAQPATRSFSTSSKTLATWPSWATEGPLPAMTSGR